MTDHLQAVGSPLGQLEAWLAERVAAAEERLLVRLRAELAAGAAVGPEWLTQPAAARLAGVTAQTIRAWIAAGHLERGHRGRVRADQLRAFLAGRPVAAPVADLRAARVAKMKAEILAGGR